MSQEDLAHAAGLHVTHISRLGRGRRAPSIVVVSQLAAALSLTTSELMAKLEQDGAGQKRKK